MADGAAPGGAKKPQGGSKFKSGCGCLFVLLLMILSFIAGGRYGKDFVDKSFEKTEQICEAFSRAYKEVSEDGAKQVNQSTAAAAKTYDDIKNNSDIKFQNVDVDFDKRK